MPRSQRRASKRPGTARATYHHGDLRAQLIDAGLERLDSSGDADLSLRDLARRTGVVPNAVYRHFANKEALLAALAAAGFRSLFEAQERAVTKASPASGAEALRVAGSTYVAFGKGRPALFRLMFGRFAATHRNADLMDAYQASVEGLEFFVRAALGEADEALVARSATTAWALVHGLTVLALDGQLDERAPTSEVIDAILAFATCLLVPDEPDA